MALIYHCESCEIAMKIMERQIGSLIKCPKCKCAQYVDPTSLKRTAAASQTRERNSARSLLETPPTASITAEDDEIDVVCTHCEHKVTTSRHNLGKTVICSYCGEGFVASQTPSRQKPDGPQLPVDEAETIALKPVERTPPQRKPSPKTVAKQKRPKPPPIPVLHAVNEDEDISAPLIVEENPTDELVHVTDSQDTIPKSIADVPPLEDELLLDDELLLIEDELPPDEDELFPPDNELLLQDEPLQFEEEPLTPLNAELPLLEEIVTTPPEIADTEKGSLEQLARIDGQLHQFTRIAGQIQQISLRQRHAETIRRNQIGVVTGQIRSIQLIRENELAAHIALNERQRLEEKTRRRQEYERKQQEEAERIRLQEEARQAAQEKEEQRKAAEEERLLAENAKRKAEEAAAECRRREQEQLKAAEEKRERKSEAKRIAEENAKRQREEQERQRKAAAELKRREDEARRKAEEKQRRKAEQVRAKLREEIEGLVREHDATAPKLEPGTAAFQELLSDQLVNRRKSFQAWMESGDDNRDEALRKFEAVERQRWRLERLTLDLDSLSDQQPNLAVQRNRLGGKLSRFLLARVEVPIAGCHLPTAIGLGNPFRVIGSPATVPTDVLTASLQKAVSSTKAKKRVPTELSVGLDRIVASTRVLKQVAATSWQNARQRIAAELFWIHLPADQFALLREIGDVTSNLAITFLNNMLETADGTDAVLVRHAIAVAWLNVAIARESAFASGQITNALGYWELAIDHWVALLDSESWWQYLTLRSTVSLVSRVRNSLPLFLSGLILRFARSYGQQGETVSLHRLVSVVRRSRLPDSIKKDGAWATVRGSFY